MRAKHRTRRTCQKFDEDFFKFCGLLRKSKLYSHSLNIHLSGSTLSVSKQRTQLINAAQNCHTRVQLSLESFTQQVLVTFFSLLQIETKTLLTTNVGIYGFHLESIFWNSIPYHFVYCVLLKRKHK